MMEVTAGRNNCRKRPKGCASWRPRQETKLLLDQVDEVLREYRAHLPLTVRQIFYRLVGAFDYSKTERGFLLRPGRLDQGTVLKIIRAAWHAGGADSKEALRDLESIVHDTSENLAVGEPVVGGPTLEDYAPGMVRLLSRWGAGPTKNRTTTNREGPKGASQPRRNYSSGARTGRSSSTPPKATPTPE